MARKSDPKPADDKTTEAAATAAEDAKPVSAETGDTDTKGGETAAETPAASETAPHTQPQGQTGGEDGTGLSADPDDVAALAAAVAELGDASITEIEFLPGATWTVVCHREGGRRRAGRHWPEGETTVPADELTDYELAQLDGDPAFTIFAHVQG